MNAKFELNISFKINITGYPQSSVQQLSDLLTIICTSVELVETLHSLLGYFLT